MPLEYVIDTDQQLVITTALGGVSTQDVTDYFEAVTRDSKTYALANLVVVADVGPLDISSQDIRALAMKVSDRWGNDLVRTAVVAPDDLSFGIARMFELFQAQPEDRFRVFRKREHALEWLQGDSTSRRGLGVEALAGLP